MKKTVNLFIIVIACILIAFYTVNITIHASEEVVNECVQCGKPADIHGGAIKIEHDGDLLVFCCPNCIDKYKKKSRDESHKDNEHDDHNSYDKQ